MCVCAGGGGKRVREVVGKLDLCPPNLNSRKKKWDHEVRVKNANKKMATLIPMGKKPFASRPEDFARPFCSCNFLLRHA